MTRIYGYKSIQNPSQSVYYNTRMPLMSSYVQTHHQHPRTSGYENQWNKSYKQNMGGYFVSILYNNNFSYSFDI